MGAPTTDPPPLLITFPKWTKLDSTERVSLIFGWGITETLTRCISVLVRTVGTMYSVDTAGLGASIR